MPETSSAAGRVPWHVAFHYLGCASDRGHGVGLPSPHAPMVDVLADAFERVTVVAYDPPAIPLGPEHEADELVPKRGRQITVLSLGPFGSWRDAWQRGRRARSIVAAASREWDVVIYWLQNRRLGVVHRPNACGRVVVIDGSCIGDEARAERAPLSTKVADRAVAAVTERIGRAIIREAGLVVVNSSMLARRHAPLNDNIVARRWTRRRSNETFQTPDRLGGGPANLLIAGRLTPYKGVFEALEAFASLKRGSLPEAHLHVAGEGRSRSELERRAKDLGVSGSVTFHGWIGGDDLFTLYRSCDLVLHLSYAESFPRVVLEALAHSVLVVCTPVGGLTDILEHDRDVIYVPPRDPGAAADAVVRLAADGRLRRKLITNGLGVARESSLDSFVGGLAEDIAGTWPELPHPRLAGAAHK
jgi:glycosyltransferase involved in cell wall biosynthesis